MGAIGSVVEVQVSLDGVVQGMREGAEVEKLRRQKSYENLRERLGEEAC